MKKFFALAAVATMAMPLFAADGAATFKAKCAGCHGADGLKAMPAMGVKPLNSPDIQSQSEAQLAAVITSGKGKMPGFGGKLSPEEITSLATYVKSLK